MKISNTLYTQYKSMLFINDQDLGTNMQLTEVSQFVMKNYIKVYDE